MGPDAFLRLCGSVRFPGDVPEPSSPRAVRLARKAVLERRAILLGSALRASEKLTPGIFAIIKDACSRLRLPQAPETFVSAGSGDLNAFCLSVGPTDVRLLGVNGELFEFLDHEEIVAVIAHELGHMALHPARGRASDNLLEELAESATSRSRELSADRVSVLAVDPPTVYRALIKIHTNLRSGHFEVDVDALVQQAGDIPPHEDIWQLAASHPFLPFRIWALHRFTSSEFYRRHRGESGGEPLERIDAEISRKLDMLGGGRLSSAHADLVNEALVWLAVLLIIEDGEISDRERRELTELVGRIRAENALEVLHQLGRAEIESHARRALQRARNAGPSVVARLVRAIDGLGASIGVDVSTSGAATLINENDATSDT